MTTTPPTDSPQDHDQAAREAKALADELALLEQTDKPGTPAEEDASAGLDQTPGLPVTLLGVASDGDA